MCIRYFALLLSILFWANGCVTPHEQSHSECEKRVNQCTIPDLWGSPLHDSVNVVVKDSQISEILIIQALTDVASKTVNSWQGVDFLAKHPLNILLGTVEGICDTANVVKLGLVLKTTRTIHIGVNRAASECDILSVILHEAGHLVFDNYPDSLWSSHAMYGNIMNYKSLGELFADVFAIWYLSDPSVVGRSLNCRFRDFSITKRFEDIPDIHDPHYFFIPAHSAVLDFFQSNYTPEKLKSFLHLLQEFYMQISRDYSTSYSISDREIIELLTKCIKQGYVSQ